MEGGEACWHESEESWGRCLHFRPTGPQSKASYHGKASASWRRVSSPGGRHRPPCMCTSQSSELMEWTEEGMNHRHSWGLGHARQKGRVQQAEDQWGHGFSQHRWSTACDGRVQTSSSNNREHILLELHGASTKIDHILAQKVHLDNLLSLLLE